MTPMRIEMPMSIASYDVDYGGVVSNIVYVRWLEDLRHALIDQLYSFDKQLAARIAPAVVETQVQYRRPLRFLDRPVGRMTVTDVEAVRLTFAAEFLLPETPPAAAEPGLHSSLQRNTEGQRTAGGAKGEGGAVATAKQACVFLRLDSGRPVRVPRELAEAFRLSVQPPPMSR